MPPTTRCRASKRVNSFTAITTATAICHCTCFAASNYCAPTCAPAILKLLLKRLRQHWPQVRIVFRGDSGFCRQRIINYCERADVGYIIGLAPRLQAITEWVELAMRDAFEQTGLKQREVSEFMYAAQSWARQRWMGNPPDKPKA